MQYEQILESAAIKDYLRVYSFEEHNLQFGVFPENQSLVSDPAGIARLILERSFAGQPFPRIREELLDAGYEEDVIRQTFERLHELNLLQDRPQPGDRYQRQRRFFEIFKDNFLPGQVYQAGLTEARVLVLGLDPLGSKIAQVLTVAGVGRVTVVDGARVEPGDVLHQHAFGADAVGEERAVAWSRRAGILNRECETRWVRGLRDLAPEELAETSLCFLCDPVQFPPREVAALCARAGVPFLFFGIEGGKGFVDPLYVSGRTPCPDCTASPLLRPAGEDGGGGDRPAHERGLLRSALGNLVALQAVKLLSGFSAPNNLHERLRLDLATYEVTAERTPSGRCEACRAAEAVEGEESLLGGAATPDSRVELYPLVESREGDQFILGREATGTFLSVGDPERKFLRLLEQGLTIRKACRAFGDFFGLPEVKVGSFLDTLAESGFLRSVDGRPLREEPREKKFHLTRLEPRHVAFLFSRPFLALYGAVVVAALVLCVRHPEYLPRYRDVYFLPSISLSLIINALVGWMIVVPHELFHLFAAKSVGCETGIGIGHRLMFVVAQTDVTNLWKVPRNRRNIVYLAGMISDLMIGSALVFGMWANDRGLLALHPYAYAFLKSALFIIAFKLGWNFLFYMRTDVYYLLANLLRCQNLYRDTVTFLKNELAREIKWIRPVVADPIPDREKRIVHLYAVFFLVGTLLTVAAFSIALMPLGLLVRNAITTGFAAGVAGKTVSLVDSAVASGLILLQLSLLTYAVISNRRKRRPVAR